MNLYSKQNRSTDIENKLMVTKGDGKEEINWKFGVNIYTLLHIK